MNKVLKFSFNLLFVLQIFKGYAFLAPKLSIKADYTKKSDEQSVLKHDCYFLIDKFEKHYALPSGMLKALSYVESQMNPWAVNFKGKGHHFKNKKDALAFAKECIKEGSVYNLDIGLCQINYGYHGKKFEDLETMFEPRHNIAYAIKFLVDLKKRHKTWQKAVGFYHSPQPAFQDKYWKKISYNMEKNK